MLALFVMMTTAILGLYCLLKLQGRIGGEGTFSKERAHLITILVIFDLSYLLRVLWDEYIAV